MPELLPRSLAGIAATYRRHGRSWLPAVLLALAVWVLAFQPAPAAAQQVSSQQLAQELQFYTGPYSPPESPGLRRNVFLVEVETVVRDAQGRSVAGLKQDDFRLYDDGKPQKITRFLVEHAGPPPLSTEPSAPPAAPGKPASAPAAAPAATPHYIALFFDDRNLPPADLLPVRTAAEKFVREDLRAGDRVGVFTSSGAVSVDFTGDRERLLHAIQSLRSQDLPLPLFELSPCTEYPLGPYAAYRILDRADSQVLQLYLCQAGAAFNGPPAALPGGRAATISAHGGPLHIEAPSQTDLEIEAQTVLASAEITGKFILGGLDSLIDGLAPLAGQRVIVLISSGFFTSTLQRELAEATRHALSAGIVVSAVDAKGLAADDSGQDALQRPNPLAPPASTFERQVLSSQRDESNDVMAELARDTGGTFFHNDNDLAAGLRQVAALPEVSYRLAFAPADLKNNGRFHNLKVEVAGPNPVRVQARRGYFAPTSAQGKLDKFQRETLASGEIAGIPAQVEAQAGLLASGAKALQVSMRLSTKALAFRNVQGRRLDRLNFVAALLDSRGKCVAGEMGLAVMALKKETLAYLTERGIDATLVVPAPAGSYRLRVVIQDAGSGKLFATTRPVAIP